jgi:hypothetical protein
VGEADGVDEAAWNALGFCLCEFEGELNLFRFGGRDDGADLSGIADDGAVSDAVSKLLVKLHGL